MPTIPLDHCRGCFCKLQTVAWRLGGTLSLYCSECAALDGAEYERVTVDDEDLDDEDLDDELLDDDDDDDDDDDGHRHQLGEDDPTPVRVEVDLPALRDAIDARLGPGQRAHLLKMLSEPPKVLRGRLDYVAVWGHEGCTDERPCDTFADAHKIVMAAKKNGATIAYVDERPVALVPDAGAVELLDVSPEDVEHVEGLLTEVGQALDETLGRTHDEALDRLRAKLGLEDELTDSDRRMLDEVKANVLGATPKATITLVSGQTFELRNPSGDFVCQGPQDFCTRIAVKNGWFYRYA